MRLTPTYRNARLCRIGFTGTSWRTCIFAGSHGERDEDRVSRSSFAGLVTTVIDPVSSRYLLITFQVVQAAGLVQITHGPTTLLRELDERKVKIVLARMSDRCVAKHECGDPVRRPGRVVADRRTRRRKIALLHLVK